MKATAGNIQSAPLFVVYGSVTANEKISLRHFALKKARNKDGVWFYPSDLGTRMVPDSMIGQFDNETTAAGKIVHKIFFTKENLVDAMKATMTKHLSKNASAPELKSAVVPAAEVAVKEKVSSKTVGAPSTGRVFTGKDLEDYVAVQNILNGHKNEFAVLYKRYYDNVLYRYSKSFNFQQNELAKDLVMEMFAKVYEKLNSYVPEFTFNAWLSALAYNFLVDYCRKKKLDTVSIDKSHVGDGAADDTEGGTLAATLAGDNSTCPENILFTEERKDALKKALAQLDVRTRRMIMMRYFQEASYAEIMEAENVSESFVKIAIFRAKHKLREVFEQNHHLMATVAA